ncbi:MAG: helix-turn-helix domain-containing protein [Deltaproteobacteria bacterium]
MTSNDSKIGPAVPGREDPSGESKAESLLSSSIGGSLDVLVEYLVDNGVDGIHPLIMGEIEKRLIIKVLERSRGNKLRAAKLLGISRNTFHRKIRQLLETGSISRHDLDI